MLQHAIKDEILTTLRNSLKIYKVILFGSLATGTAERDSDIDLIVVTDDDSMPRSYRESMQNYLSVSAVLREIKARVISDNYNSRPTTIKIPGLRG